MYVCIIHALKIGTMEEFFQFKKLNDWNSTMVLLWKFIADDLYNESDRLNINF